MPHQTGLIATISVALAVAFLGGFVATRLRLPAIVGYLLAGVAVGPFTPGFVADGNLAPQLAELGIILLMFGVGIHFSVRDLLAVRGVALPGALGQIVAATALTLVVAVWWGWSPGAGLVLGLAISVASTVVLLRALEARNELELGAGRIAIGWLIVEDLFTVLALVLLPVLAVPLGGAVAGAGEPSASGGGAIVTTLALTLGKVALLAAVMFVVGARFVPWLLVQVARTGSRELFTLAVLAVALGIAFGAAQLFGVSFALGAFLAGLVVGESDLSHRAAADALPLRDAFAVLFFVSVGMLFDPTILLSSPGKVLAMVALIVVAKALAAFLLVVLLGYPLRTGLIAAGLAQIGEFSFILAELGRTLGLLPGEGYSLVLAGAILSITVNPLLFRAVDPVDARVRRRPGLAAIFGRRARGDGRLPAPPAAPEAGPPSAAAPRTATAAGRPAGRVVICGFGRVGSLVGETLEHHGVPFVVVDLDRGTVETLRRRGVVAFYGDAAADALLTQAGVATARLLVVAIPDPLATRHIVEEARRRNAALSIVARTHSEAERTYLSAGRADAAVLGERLLAEELARLSLEQIGIGGDDRAGAVRVVETHAG